MKKIILAKYMGFCGGVSNAIKTVDNALDENEHPIYVYNEIVHNKHVVNSLKDKGVIFVDNLKEVPKGATLIFSAHGISEAIENEAKKKFNVIDATCPLVKCVHNEVIKYNKSEYEIIIIGKHDHDEVIGIAGRIKKSKPHIISSIEDVKNLNLDSDKKIAFVTQTTLSQDECKNIIAELKKKFPNIISNKNEKNICRATQVRQESVSELSKKCDLILVIGSKNSSNSRKLQDVAENNGTKAYLIDDESEIDENWFNNIEAVGITAGASVPDEIINGIVSRLEKLRK